MNILLVGSGGREHALAWAIAASPLCTKLFCAPGNAGIAQEAECVPIPADDVPGLVAFARHRKVDFVVVGPETPLVAGLVDRMEEAGIRAFGPTADAALLESSKSFCKAFCEEFAIPTAKWQAFEDPDDARTYVAAEGVPIVIKADGLAAGKGVTVCRTLEEANQAIDDCLVEGRFGSAGARIVVEEFLQGAELSFFALVDGATALPLGSAEDHKQVGDGDTGPNTGGMGAISPSPLMTPALEQRILREIVGPTVRGMRVRRRPFRGLLYAGLMLTEDAEGPAPKLVEYNVRFGDPECQVLVRRLASDLLPALLAARDGVLTNFDLRWYEETAVCVVLAARGYPGAAETGAEVGDLDAAEAIEDVKVFHAATRRDREGRLLADGGRVLGVTALGRDADEARSRAYAAVDAVAFPGATFRRDIGARRR